MTDKLCTTLQVRLSSECNDKLNKKCSELNCKKSDLIRDILEKELSSTPVNREELVDIVEQRKGNDNVIQSTTETTSTKEEEKVVVNEKEINPFDKVTQLVDWSLWNLLHRV